jgi:hypothetical protein
MITYVREVTEGAASLITCKSAGGSCSMTPTLGRQLMTIDSLTANMRPNIKTIFRRLAETCPENAAFLCEFIIAKQIEMNIAETTKDLD